MAICKVSKNFIYNPDYETAHLPADKFNVILSHSKACFHIYSYLSLKADKRHDIGIVRKTSNMKIADALGMSLRTVQHCMKQLYDSELLSYKLRYRSREKDIYLEGFKEMYDDNNYIKLPAEVFSEDFLTADKGSMSLALNAFTSIYKNVLAQFQKLKAKNKDAQNHELIDKVSIHREFLATTLLTKIKRVCVKDLEESIEKVKILGFDITVDESRDIWPRKYIVAAYGMIKKMFKPKENNLSIVKRYPLAFESVKEWLSFTDLGNKFIYIKELEDLTQMIVQYGDIPFVAGLLKFKEYALNRIDEIPSRCAYIRTCIDKWLSERESNALTSF